VCNKTKLIKNIALGFGMLIFVAVIAGATYFIVYNKLKPNMLIAPTNVYLLEDNILTWDNVEGSIGYDIRFLNRTTSSNSNISNVRIYETHYNINNLNKVAYDISSHIESDKNYSISVKAISNTVGNSGYSVSCELEQVDPFYDVNPYRLTSPTNIEYLSNGMLTWDNLENADSYTIEFVNITDDETLMLEVTSEFYSVDEFNKVSYYLGSRIEVGKSYSVIIRANSDEIVDSEFSEIYLINE
jgi:hypothetical protein